MLFGIVGIFWHFFVFFGFGILGHFWCICQWLLGGFWTVWALFWWFFLVCFFFIFSVAFSAFGGIFQHFGAIWGAFRGNFFPCSVFAILTVQMILVLDTVLKALVRHHSGDIAACTVCYGTGHHAFCNSAFWRQGLKQLLCVKVMLHSLLMRQNNVTWSWTNCMRFQVEPARRVPRNLRTSPAALSAFEGRWHTHGLWEVTCSLLDSKKSSLSPGFQKSSFLSTLYHSQCPVWEDA